MGSGTRPPSRRPGSRDIQSSYCGPSGEFNPRLLALRSKRKGTNQYVDPVTTQALGCDRQQQKRKEHQHAIGPWVTCL